MTTVVEAHPNTQRTSPVVRLAGPSLVLGGVAFFLGGVTHPSDSGEGTKVQQLHEMLVDPSWYPSHALLLAAMALFAVGIFALRQRRNLSTGMERLLQVVFVIACVATLAMAVHLFAAIGADSLADGKHSLVSRLQTVNETVVDTAWGLALATLAVAGGLTRTVGNRLTIPFGLVGGLAFALASATIAFTDTFDSLFKLGSLLSIWAILVGSLAIRRREDETETANL
jgi:hypothetical protein